jgi:hypothetical protein
MAPPRALLLPALVGERQRFQESLYRHPPIALESKSTPSIGKYTVIVSTK